MTNRRWRMGTIWHWGWPLAGTILLVAAGVAILRTVAETDEARLDIYTYTVLYVGIVSLVILAVMLGLTRVWTLLALGLLASYAAISILETLSSTLTLGWITIDPWLVGWIEDSIVSGLAVGATLALIGMISNVWHKGEPVQPHRAFRRPDQNDEDEPRATGLP